MGGSDILSNIHAIDGSSFDDALIGDNQNDVFQGNGGNNNIKGGNGINQADYSTAPAAINANLATGIVQNGWNGTDTLTNIQVISGSKWGDTLTGGAGNDVFLAGDGNNRIDGGGGFNTADYNYDAGVGYGPISANLTAGYVNHGDGSRDTLTNIQSIVGTMFDDTLVGSDADETFAPGAGTNTVDGEGGNNTLILDFTQAQATITKDQQVWSPDFLLGYGTGTPRDVTKIVGPTDTGNSGETIQNTDYVRNIQTIRFVDGTTMALDPVPAPPAPPPPVVVTPPPVVVTPSQPVTPPVDTTPATPPAPTPPADTTPPAPPVASTPTPPANPTPPAPPAPTGPQLSYTDTTTHAGGTVPFITPPAGSPNYLQEWYIWSSPDGVAMRSDTPNVFIHGGSGDDAMQVTSGQNVLNGGLGSNYLIGGTGQDTFFTDSRQAGVVWNTIINFHAGDYATLWGFDKNVSSYHWDDQLSGADGAKGATLRANIVGGGGRTGDGIDASMTFAGLSVAQAKQLSVTTGTQQAGNYIMLFNPGV